MVRGQETPLNVNEYVKTLRPIKTCNLQLLKSGQKIFNRCSLNISYIDTFVSYDSERDVVTYINYKGEEWSGAGKDYWYFID